MSIYVHYQPLDIEAIQRVVFPYIRGSGQLDELLRLSENPSAALTVIDPCRNAYAAMVTEAEYFDREWGSCDPVDFLLERTARSVLAFARHIWPSWSVKAISSDLLLPDDFPVLEHFRMPITLFQPLVDEIPEIISSDLETIADAGEIMGGVVPKDHVEFVRRGVQHELEHLLRSSGDPPWIDAAQNLLEALTYAQTHQLSFTEAIE